MTSPCEAFLPMGGAVRTEEAQPCGKTPTRLYVIACVHEHVRERWACNACTAMNEYCLDYCGLCYDADGHICPVVVAPAVGTVAP